MGLHCHGQHTGPGKRSGGSRVRIQFATWLNAVLLSQRKLTDFNARREIMEQNSPEETRRIVFDDIRRRASNLTRIWYFEGTVKLEVVDGDGVWHEKDHYWTQWKVSDCLDMPLIWSYFSSAEEVADPI